TRPASAATLRPHSAPARNLPARTLGALARWERGTPAESTHPTAPGIRDSPPVAESVPFHLRPSAPAETWERNMESPTAGTAHAFRKRHQSDARMPDIFRE